MADVALTPVDHDPFTPALTPVDHDPFAADRDRALAAEMTHWPQQPNPAAPILNGVSDFMRGGIVGVMRGQGAQLPDWVNEASDVAQSQPFNAALGMAAPPERFMWPVRTLYGKTIDMPVSVNPSRSMILRELAQAPHGDVRALKTPDGDVYLWPANEAMHVDIANTFDLPFKTRQDLQKASYLFNKRDVDAVGKFSDFDDLMSKLKSAAD